MALTLSFFCDSKIQQAAYMAVFFFRSSQFTGVRRSVFQIAKLNSLLNQHIAKI